MHNTAVGRMVAGLALEKSPVSKAIPYKLEVSSLRDIKKTGI